MFRDINIIRDTSDLYKQLIDNKTSDHVLITDSRHLAISAFIKANAIKCALDRHGDDNCIMERQYKKAIGVGTALSELTNTVEEVKLNRFSNIVAEYYGLIKNSNAADSAINNACKVRDEIHQELQELRKLKLHLNKQQNMTCDQIQNAPILTQPAHSED